MNNFLGGFGGVAGSKIPGEGGVNESTYPIYKKTSDLITQASWGPSGTFLFTDERQDCINWGNYETDMIGDGIANGDRDYAFYQDMPGFYHNNSGAFSFTDGHAELHHWVSTVTYPALTPTANLSTALGAINGPAAGGLPAPRDPDVLWLQGHTVKATPTN
jgi:prepilin-type processing-associated H-X9-DG protein